MQVWIKLLADINISTFQKIRQIFKTCLLSKVSSKVISNWQNTIKKVCVTGFETSKAQMLNYHVIFDIRLCFFMTYPCLDATDGNAYTVLHLHPHLALIPVRTASALLDSCCYRHSILVPKWSLYQEFTVRIRNTLGFTFNHKLVLHDACLKFDIFAASIR